MSKSAASAAAVVVKLIVPAGKATAGPPVGPALGARGVKSMDFCKDFNARTLHLVPETPTPVLITVQPDRTFTYVIKTPPTSWLIKKAADITMGAAEPGIPGAKTAGTLSLKHIYEIALIKARDDHIKHQSLEGIARSVQGTCRSMGVKVIA